MSPTIPTRNNEEEIDNEDTQIVMVHCGVTMSNGKPCPDFVIRSSKRCEFHGGYTKTKCEKFSLLNR